MKYVNHKSMSLSSSASSAAAPASPEALAPATFEIMGSHMA